MALARKVSGLEKAGRRDGTGRGRRNGPAAGFLGHRRLTGNFFAAARID